MERPFHAVRDLLLFVFEMFVVGQNVLDFAVLAVEERQMRLEGFVFGPELLVFLLKGHQSVDDSARFCFNLFDFIHKSIILLELSIFQTNSSG
jgi:hypothetical protein